MPKNVVLEVRGIAELQKAYQDKPKFHNLINRSVYAMTLGLERAAKYEAPVDQGALRAQIFSKTQANTLSGFISTGPSTPYAIYVHEGTRPHWPPYGEGSSLSRWARSHGMDPFLAARSIATKGTKANPFMDRALKSQKPYITRELDNLSSNLAKALNF